MKISRLLMICPTSPVLQNAAHAHASDAGQVEFQMPQACGLRRHEFGGMRQRCDIYGLSANANSNRRRTVYASTSRSSQLLELIKTLSRTSAPRDSLTTSRRCAGMTDHLIGVRKNARAGADRELSPCRQSYTNVLCVPFLIQPRPETLWDLGATSGCRPPAGWLSFRAAMRPPEDICSKEFHPLVAVNQDTSLCLSRLRFTLIIADRGPCKSLQ